jgi:hypothetical protein
MLVLIALLTLAPGSARAGTHTVQRGETLEHVAKVYGCSVDAVLRANRLKTTLVRPGTRVRVPDCTVRARARARTPRSKDDAADRAEQALAVIDGTATVTSSRSADAERDEPGGEGQAIGEPWDGRLEHGERLPRGEGYQIRRPQRAYGAAHVVEHLQGAIASVRALYDVHTLAIGDLSASAGGRLGGHHSHQSGLDVDIGFYFHRMPDGYPDSFVAASGDLDLASTWALILAFERTSHLDTGVQVIFLDHAVQARLYAYAKQRGTPADDLAAILQYPRDADVQAGLVRHWPRHADHLHVRFKPGKQD